MNLLFKNSTIERFSQNEVIINAYNNSRFVYRIKKGFVKSYYVTDDGDVKTQLIRSAGDIFPLLWVLAGVKRDVFFSAMDDITVEKVLVSEFRKTLETNSECAKEVNNQLVEIYMLMAERVRNLELTSACDRLEYCLGSLADRFGIKHKRGVIIEAPIHHHDIAEMINTSRETTSREFSKLEKAGSVDYVGSSILIKS